MRLHLEHIFEGSRQNAIQQLLAESFDHPGICMGREMTCVNIDTSKRDPVNWQMPPFTHACGPQP